LVLAIGVLGSPATSFAQNDAGATAPVAAVEPAPVAAPEPAVEPAPALVAEVAEVSTPAVAEPAATKTSLDKLSSEIMNILVPVFVTLIGGLAAAFLAWVRKKAKLDVSDKQINQWSMVAEMAAGRAGEWARNKTKELAEGKTLPGPEILEVGVNWGLDYGIAHGLPDIGREKLEGLIESKLHFKRPASLES
jgi:hypothetical protein